MRAQAAALFFDVFKVRPHEARRAGLAFVYLFAAIGAFIVGRIARTVLFLEIPEFKQLLPFAYIGTAVTVSITMALYARVERVLRRDHTNAVTLVLLTLVTLAFRLALGHGRAWASWAFYFWVEMYGTFVVVQFWSLAGELFNPREAKRLFAFIGGGGVLANVAIGVAINGAVQKLGTENLLYLVCGCFVVSLVMVWLLGNDAARELEAARGRKKNAAAPKHGPVLATKHVKLLALVVVVTYLVSTIVDYQFQAIIGDSIPAKDARSAYLGGFFAVTGVIAGVIQLFFTSRIVERGGLLVALLLLPCAMLTGSVGLMLVPLLPALAMVVFTKGSENCLRYTVNDSTLQLLYLPLPAAVRGRAKTFIDGVLKPVSVGIAGVALGALVGSLATLVPSLSGLPTISTAALAWVVAALLVCWIVLLARLRREYVKSLVQTLEQRRLDFANASFDVKDEATMRTLATALRSERLGDVLHALELLRSVPPATRQMLDAEVTPLLHHATPEVRVAALRLLAATPDSATAAEMVATRLADDEPRVRAAAVLAITALEREKASDTVTPLLSDSDVRVRAATIAGLIRHGGLDGVVRSAGELKTMIASGDAHERERGGWILGEVGVATFYQPLVPLLSDPDMRVRRTAIEAAGKLASPALLPILVAGMGTVRLAAVTIAAIARFGSPGLDAAVRLLRDPTASRDARVNAAKLVARFPESRSVMALLSELESTDMVLRTAVVRALLRLEAADTALSVDAKAVRKALRDEAHRYFELLATERDVDAGTRAPLLADALAHRLRTTRDRMLGLVALLGRDPSVDAAIRNLASSKAAVRGNAVEVLDNVLEKDDKQLVIPVVDDTTVQHKLEVATAAFKLRRATREERLRQLLTSGDTWLATCAAVATADLALPGLELELDVARESHDSLCREAAELAITRLRTASPVTRAS